MQKGSSTILNVTQEAHHRVFVGLGWDPRGQAGLIGNLTEKLSGKALHHDLDLSCCLYDANNQLIDIVSAETAHAADRTGKIYHSGDSIEGEGPGDDEQISVELKDIDPAIRNIIFAATIKSGHSFGDIHEPEIRLADGYSNREFLVSALHADAGQDKSGYVFVRLYIEGDAWMVQNIGEFFDAGAEKSLADFLKTFIE
ncbi:MAG: TerD family protein [Alphaproteobacteria bacterium]|nr:TerD family protein [Alphaproteobacteria bacterium]